MNSGPRLKEDKANGCIVRSWDERRDVLTTKSFPLTTVLRWGTPYTERCNCLLGHNHRSLFEWNLANASKVTHGRPLQDTLVCWNALSLFESRIPKKLSGWKDRVPLIELPTVGHVMNVLWNGTYWFRRLASPNSTKKIENIQPWETFSVAGEMILRALAGKSAFHKRGGKRLIRRELYKMKLSTVALGRLKQLLTTVDGLCLQIVTSFPGEPEIQNWDYFDNLIVGQVKNLFFDYFTDLRKKETSMRNTHYGNLKRFRGAILENGMKPNHGLASIDIPRQFSALALPLSFIRRRTPLDFYRIGMLTQNRGAGTPPPAVFGQAALKLKQTLERPVLKLTAGEISLLTRGTRDVWENIVRRVGVTDLMSTMTSWLNKSGISLSDSAKLGFPRSIGGGIEFARQCVENHGAKGIRKVDLEDGSLMRTIIYISDVIPRREGDWNYRKVGVGEFLFNISALAMRDVSKRYERGLMDSEAKPVEVAGKVRMVTVSDFKHGCFLHPISHVMSEALKNDPSAKAGFSKANHLWEFYKRICRGNPSAEFLFNSIRGEKWVLSMDLSEATDHSHPEVATILIGGFSARMGLPRWYRETCTWLLTQPRNVIFDHEFEVGKKHTPETVPTIVRSMRGVFQGDPGCKFFLQLSHAVSDRVAKYMMPSIAASRIRSDPYGGRTRNPNFGGRSSSVATLDYLFDTQDGRNPEIYDR